MDNLPIEYAAVADLKYDPDNARVHDGLNLDAIEASLRRFGLRKPIVVTADLTVVAGNGTLEVLRERLRWDTVAVTVFPGTPEEARAFAVADNRTAELAEWDTDLLQASLLTLDPDLLAAAGYDPDSLHDLAAQPHSSAGQPKRNHADGEEDRADWQLLRVQVPPPMLDRYEAVSRAFPGDDVAVFAAVLTAAERVRPD